MAGRASAIIGAWGPWAGADKHVMATRRPSTAWRRGGSGRLVREDNNIGEALCDV